MIIKIKIADIASYSSEGASFEPKPINYIFGTNGVGKTTISRVIKDQTLFPECKICWKHNQEIEPFVYNQDFIEENFASEIKGIFSLGKENVEANKQLQERQEEQERINTALKDLNLQKTQKNSDKNKVLATLEKTCWDFSKRCDDHLLPAFVGFRGSKNMFCKKVIAEDSCNNVTSIPLSTLINDASDLFSSSAQKSPLIAIPDFYKIKEITDNAIWKEPIVGQKDTDIAELITFLKNSDWVREGERYLQQSKDKCPFCQQELPHSFKENLQTHFDDKFNEKLKLIAGLILSHNVHSKNVLEILENLTEQQKKILDIDKFNLDIQELRKIFEKNNQLLESKKKESSRKIELQDFEKTVTKVGNAIKKANQEISIYNEKLDNIEAERVKLASQIWRYVLEELKDSLKTYKRKNNDIDKAITTIESKIDANQSELENIGKTIRELEKKTLTVETAIKGINDILKEYNFKGFELVKDANNKNMYRLAREGQTDEEVHKTLSEGEKSFISFLYFYHLINGSQNSSKTNSKRLVVFDDPVSSLDSNTLFIVSTLIRKILSKIQGEQGNIKQAFVLTHNVFFHKEVSFGKKSKKESKHGFWVVRKDNEKTKIIPHGDENPIKTSYELLWEEVKSNNGSSHALPNTLRRILEYYFTILGGYKLDELLEKFTGEDQIIAQSLISLLHSGSHSVFDDSHYGTENIEIERQLVIFKKIFEKTGHIAHYDMMNPSS